MIGIESKGRLAVDNLTLFSIVIVPLRTAQTPKLLEIKEIRQEASNTLGPIPKRILVPTNAHPVRILIPTTSTTITHNILTTVRNLAEIGIRRATSTLFGCDIVYGCIALAVHALSVDEVGFLFGAGRVGCIGAIDVVLGELVGEPGSRGELDHFVGKVGAGAGCLDYGLLASLVLAGIVEKILVVLVLSCVFVQEVVQIVLMTGIGS